MSAGKKRTVSVTDVMFVIALITLIAVSVYKIGLFDRLFVNGKTETCTVTFAADGIGLNEAGYLGAGSRLYYGREVIGTMRGGSLTTPGVDTVMTPDGKYVFSESDSKIDIRGAFESSLTQTEYGWLFNGKTYIVPGTVLDVRCGDAQLKLTVISIDVRSD